MNSKPFWKSKTLWLNLVATLVYLVTNYSGLLKIPAEWALPALAALNAALRLLTGQPIELSLKGGGKVTIGPLLLVCLFLATVAGCAPAGQFDQSRQVRYDAALAYLESSLANVQAASEQAKLQHPENAAAIDAQVSPVVAQLRAAVQSYKAAVDYSAPGEDAAWVTARAVLTTAVSVLGPVAINALVQ